MADEGGTGEGFGHWVSDVKVGWDGAGADGLVFDSDAHHAVAGGGPLGFTGDTLAFSAIEEGLGIGEEGSGAGGSKADFAEENAEADGVLGSAHGVDQLHDT